MNTLKKASLLPAVLMLIVFCTTAFSPPGWDKLGSRTVNWSVDHDVIVVTAANGKYSGMKLMVERNGVNFVKVIVHFGNGTRQDVALRNNIQAGGETRLIDFKGSRRTIKKIDFFYSKNRGPKPGKAIVTAFGKR